LPQPVFFDKLNTDVETRTNVTADIQSILGIAMRRRTANHVKVALSQPARVAHQLSNRGVFMRTKLVISQARLTGADGAGVPLFWPMRCYDRGKTRTNQIEAEAVADAVIHHALNNPKPSLGVVGSVLHKCSASERAGNSQA